MSIITSYSIIAAEFASILDVFDIDTNTSIDFLDDSVVFLFDEFAMTIPLSQEELRYGDGVYDVVMVPGEVAGTMEMIDESVAINYKIVDTSYTEEFSTLLIFIVFASRLAFLLSENDELPDAEVYLKDNRLGIYFIDYDIEFTCVALDGAKEFSKPAQFIFENGQPVLNLV